MPTAYFARLYIPWRCRQKPRFGERASNLFCTLAYSDMILNPSIRLKWRRLLVKRVK